LTGTTSLNKKRKKNKKRRKRKKQENLKRKDDWNEIVDYRLINSSRFGMIDCVFDASRELCGAMTKRERTMA